MKFTVQKQNLISAMDIAIRVIPAKSMQPILGCFLIEVDGMDGYITATGIQQSIRTRFTCMSEESGKVCVEAKTLMQAIKKMGKSDVTIQSDENSVIITGAKARYEFPTRAIDEYPPFPTFGDASKMTVNALRFGSMIDGVAFSASQKDGNKIITGINMSVKNGEIRLSALDMVRIAIRKCSLQNDVNPINVTIPAGTMQSIAKSVSDGEIEIEVGKTQVRFTFGDTTMVSRTIDGKFYDIDKMVKQDLPIHVSCRRSDLSESIDRSLVICDNNQPLVLDVSDDSIHLSMKSSLSNFDEEASCEKTGGDVKIGVNPVYMLEALKATDSDDVTILLMNGNSPLLIVDEVSGEYIYIVLPVSL